MILGVKLLGIIFGLAMAYFTFLYHKRGEFKKPQFLFWELVWAFLIFLSLFSQTLNAFTRGLGFIRTIDFLMILAFMFLGFLAFHNYINLQRIKKNMEQKTREEALDELKNELKNE